MLRSGASAQPCWRRKAHERNCPSRLAFPSFARSIGLSAKQVVAPDANQLASLNQASHAPVNSIVMCLFMKLRKLHLSAIGFLAFCVITSYSIHAQTTQNPKEDKIVRFVKDLIVKLNNKKSLTYSFTGEFRTLPEDLEKSLTTNFPKHRVKVAALEYFHYSSMPTSIIVVTDAESGEVLSYCGDIFVFGCDESEPFYDLLSAYEARSKKDALEKVRVLSKLIVYPDWRVRRVYMKGKTIYSEFDTGLKDPWRILKVSLDKQKRFSRFVIVNPREKNAKKIFPNGGT